MASSAALRTTQSAEGLARAGAETKPTLPSVIWAVLVTVRVNVEGPVIVKPGFVEFKTSWLGSGMATSINVMGNVPQMLQRPWSAWGSIVVTVNWVGLSTTMLLTGFR